MKALSLQFFSDLSDRAQQLKKSGLDRSQALAVLMSEYYNQCSTETLNEVLDYEYDDKEDFLKNLKAL